MRIPGSTYRLQVNAGFRLAQIGELIDYFAELGVTDLYLSPVLEARPGSTHGYDVTNPAHVNHEIGSAEEFETLSRALRDRGLRILLDIVPNHMAASEENPWWRDVLRHGPSSRYASFFDIDWSGDPTGLGRVVLPLLGRIVTECVDAGEIRVALDEEAPAIVYFDRRFPIDPGTYSLIIDALPTTTAAGLPALARRAAALPARTDLARAEERHALGNRLELDFAEALRTLPREGMELSPASVARVLEAQAYALTHWQRGSDLVNYRRFFDISDLAGLRMDRAEVFEAIHQRILPWLADGTIAGVRIDHIDGLRDPEGYLNRLWFTVPEAQPYIVVEKILIGDEPLPETWKVEGTSGYDFLGLSSGLFIDPAGWDTLGTAYARWTGTTDFAELAYEKKKLALRKLFAGEARTLTRRLAAATQLGNEECFNALVELTGLLPVYRTYRNEQGILPHDAHLISETAQRARSRGAPTMAVDALETLLLDPQGDEQHELAMRWQQFTGPVTAKGVEDTAFYNYHRLISACEVGADPAAAPTTVAHFHERMRERVTRWPHALNGTSTHDTKRSEDVRMRIHVLSELAEEWIEWVDGCLNAGAPDQADALQLLQTLIGAWPLDDQIDAAFRQRLHRFIEKAARESKRCSSWLEPDLGYETSLQKYCDHLLADRSFVAELKAFEPRTSFCGALNSLSLLAIKLAAPGVPDIYQGTERWALSLVDPDNRSPVDYSARRGFRAPEDIKELRASWRTGAIKQALTQRGLQLRHQRPALFSEGDYLPIGAHGPRAHNLVAFSRSLAGETVTVVAGRFFAGLTDPESWPAALDWQDTVLEMEERPMRDVLTGRSVQSARVSDILAHLPVALLSSSG